MPSKAKFLTAVIMVLAFLAAAATAQAQRGTVQVIQNKVGALESPARVAVNETTGNVYVLEDAGPVKVYSSSGDYLFQFYNDHGGGFGAAPGGIAIDQATGRIYASVRTSEAGLVAAQVFDAAGHFLFTFASQGRNHLGIDPTNGDVYFAGTSEEPVGTIAANYGADLRVYDSAGSFVRSSGWDVDADNPSTGFEVCSASSGHKCKLGAPGSGDGQLNPSVDTRTAVALNPSNGDTYVVDSRDGPASNDRVQVFDSTGNYKFKFGSKGSGQGRLSNPSSISIDHATGDVLVLDDGNDRIEVFDASGAYKAELPLPEGTGTGEFQGTPDFAFDQASNRLYVLDSSNRRVQALDASTGSFILAFGQQVDLSTGADLCTAASGDTCQAATNISGIGGLAVNDATGDLYAVISDPYARTSGRVFVYDESGNFLHRLGISGGSEAGHLAGAAGIAIDQVTGATYVLEAANNRVSKFDSSGNFLFSFGWDVNQTQAGEGLELCPRPGKAADVCQAGKGGPEAGQIGNFSGLMADAETDTGIAVSPDGEVYISEPGFWERGYVRSVGNRRVQIFSQTGSLVSTVAVPHSPQGCIPGGLHDCSDPSEPFHVAVDSEGGLFTTSSPLGTGGSNACPADSPIPAAGLPCQIKQFSAAGDYLGPFAEGDTFGRLFNIAIDTSNDRVYAYQAASPEGQQYEVAGYDATGGAVEQIALGLPKPSTGGSATSGLAVRTGTTRAYASDGQSRIFVLDTLPTLPAVTINTPSGVTSNSASFSGTANLNTEALDGGYHFEYRELGTTAWKLAGPEAHLSPGTSPVSTSQSISGLKPNSGYEVRLVVTRSFGGGAATSVTKTFTTTAEAPVISLLQASPVTDTAATLRAYIDARLSATTYFFEYGADESYGTVVPLGEDGDAGAQLGPEGVLERIEGLQPGTTYHFRVTATNQAGPVQSDDASFTTRSAAETSWPARGLELVNSAEKGNQSATLVREEPSSEGGTLGVPGIDPSGSRVAWLTTSGAPGSTTGAAAPFFAERTAAGWVSRPLTPAASEQPAEGTREYERPVAASPDMTKFAFVTTHGVSTAAEHALVRVEATPTGLRHQIIDVLPIDTQVGFGFGRIVVMAADGTLLYGKGTGTDQNQVAKGEEIFIAGADGIPQQLPTPACEATLVAAAKGSFSRVLLLSAGDTNCNGPKLLYSLEPDSGQLEPISGPPDHGSAAAADNNSNSVRISDDGSTVIYRTATALVGDDTNGINDLYRWQPGTGNECLTCAAGGLGNGSTTHTSKDLSHIYIRTSSELVPGTPGGGLYVWRGGEIHFISPTGGADLVTPDGKTMVFWAGAKGITADQLDACRTTDGPVIIEHESINPCSQLYLYSEARGTIECISCPAEPQEVGVQPEPGGAQKAFNYALAADGETVGFLTAAALVRADVNNTLDVYEWHNGVVRLVTNGVSEWPDSVFAKPAVGGISADGRDLVFSVGAPLSGHEADSFAQIYDARIGGGFPVELPPAPCVEDACQGPLQAPPPLSNPASSNFNGQGNAAATHAKHRQSKKHKKKRPRHARKGKRANHNRGGAK